jgi:dihydroorotate dehydrogenase
MPEIFKGYEDGFLPFGPAAGAISGLNEDEIINHILDVARSPASFVKWGSITFNRNSGNTGRTYNHNSLTGVTSNAMGLPNIGDAAAKKIQKRLQPIVEAEGKELIPSFSPGSGENAYEVLPQIALGLAEIGVREMEVNYSCNHKPSKKGDGFEVSLGKDLDTMFEVDQKIVDTIGPGIRLNRKLYPYIWDMYLHIPKVINYFNELAETNKSRVGLSLFNSVGPRQMFDERGEPALAVGDKHENQGSISGPILADLAIGGLRRFKQDLHPEVKVFSSLGVYYVNQIFKRVDSEGADATEAVTILWKNEERGKKFGQTITEFAEKYHEIKEAA